MGVHRQPWVSDRSGALRLTLGSSADVQKPGLDLRKRELFHPAYIP